MALFKKKPEMDFIVPHADSFKDFNRIKLATYRDEYAHAGIRKLGTKQIRTVGFQTIKHPGTYGINVSANDNRIGTIWSDSWKDYYKQIKAGKVYAAHVDIVDPDEVYLYIAL
jgi:hypothetical protein